MSKSARSKPGFWGVIGPHSRPLEPSQEPESRAVWDSENQHIRAWVYGTDPRLAMSWHEIENRRGQPAALIFGSPFIASDRDYGESTRIERLDPAEAPDAVASLYQRHGTGAFALLDGDFCLVLSDPESHATFFVADKFGCNDIFIRQIENCILFATDCGSLLDASTAWDPLAAAFFLGQHGFVPGPYTLSSSVRSAARGHFLRVRGDGNSLRVERECYWRPSVAWDIRSTESAASKFLPLLRNATAVRMGASSSLLLSGGADSSLLLNIARPLACPDFPALTGTVKGYAEGEREIAKAASLAAALGAPHASVIIDPDDDVVPEEWALCSGPSMTGTRISMPLFLRFGDYLRDRVGGKYTVLSGQMADTLADNNYTLPSPGYTLRRSFCSSWFLSLMPWFRFIAPRKERFVGRSLISLVRSLRGPRFAGMVDSVLDAMPDTSRFYDGRLFGYGEMPGRSAAYFPALGKDGFEKVADWYSGNFVKPVVADLTPSTFYRNMIELSMDMVMLHLDTRPVFQVFRLAGGSAQLPFLDARIVNFFCSIPYSARAVYRQPKHVIRDQFRRHHLTRHGTPVAQTVSAAGKGAALPDELLLRGSLGAYFRELLREGTLPDRAPGLFELVDERYFTDQVRSFRKRDAGVDYPFITKLAALELWSQTVSKRKSVARTLSAIG